MITYKPFQEYHQSRLWAVKLKCSFQASAVALGIQILWTWIAKLQIKLWTWNWFCRTNIWLITRGRASKAVCGYGWSIYSFWDQQKVLELAEMQTSAGTNRWLPCACQSSSQELFYFAKWQKRKAQQKWYKFLKENKVQFIINYFSMGCIDAVEGKATWHKTRGIENRRLSLWHQETVKSLMDRSKTALFYPVCNIISGHTEHTFQLSTASLHITLIIRDYNKSGFFLPSCYK